jgi:hypothetical protein
MAHNPYAPPTAPVADVPTDGTAKNQAVWIACTLLWVSVGISLLATLFDLLRAPPAEFWIANIIGTLIGGAVGLLVTYWLISKLKAGRNWMRLLFTICNVLGCISIVVFWDFYRTHVFPIYTGNPIMAVQAVFQSILGLCAVGLLNAPSARAWFASSKRGAGSINPPPG